MNYRALDREGRRRAVAGIILTATDRQPMTAGWSWPLMLTVASGTLISEDGAAIFAGRPYRRRQTGNHSSIVGCFYRYLAG